MSKLRSQSSQQQVSGRRTRAAWLRAVERGCLGHQERGIKEAGKGEQGQHRPSVQMANRRAGHMGQKAERGMTRLREGSHDPLETQGKGKGSGQYREPWQAPQTPGTQGVLRAVSSRLLSLH